jgi:glycosyltransferase involved in cell wall biosynthesis
MKFSIVTPSFNQVDYIERTIKSVLSQQKSGISVEYTVRDNCSTDGTQEILNSYKEDYKIKVVATKDKGQADAINQGWSDGDGEILGWLNSDDIYCENALKCVADYFETHPDVMAVYGEAIYIDESDNILQSVTNIRNYSKNLLLSHDFIIQPATFIRREVFERVGPLSTSYRYIFDWEYWIRISHSYDFVRLPVTLAGYRITGNNLTTQGGKQRFKEMLHLVWHFGGLIHLIRFLLRLGKKYLLDGPEIPETKHDALIPS